MKNTKHTENLDNSTPQEITSQSKRKILTSIGVSSGIIGASAISHQWTKPIVNSIILPAHAHTTDAMGKGPVDSDHYHDKDNNGNHAKKPDDDDTSDDDTDDGDTSGPGAPSIVLSKSVITLQEGGDATAAQMMETYTVRLGSMPEEDVTVAMSGQEGNAAGDVTIDEQSLTFTKENYMTPQEVTVSVTDEDPVSADNAGDKTIRIIHSAFSYAPMVAVLTVTVVDQDVFKPEPTASTVTGGISLSVAQAVALSKAELAEGELAVFWAHHEKAETTGYEVLLQEADGVRFVSVGTYPADARNTPVLTRKKGTTYTARVIATYRDGDEVSADAAPVATTGTAS